MTQSLILAIDQGGQSSRVAIYNCIGEQLYCFSSPCTTHIFQSENYAANFIEQSGYEILTGIRECLQKIQVVLGDDLGHVIAAGFAGQGSSMLCWDNKTGEALTPILSWQDIRGESFLKNIMFTHEQAQAMTGLRLSPHYGASKIRWCIENYSAVIHALSINRLSAGPIVSYIFWHLLQQNNLVDPGHAQRTLLWSLRKNNWDAVLLDLFKIPQSVLPRCVYHDSYFGDLILGGYSVPFTASARDQGASLFARGFPDINTCYINIGTGAFIQRINEKLHAPEGLLVSPLWLTKKSSTSNLFCWEATINGAASAINFIQQQIALDINLENITAALELAPQGEGCFLNAVGGLGSPYWRTDLQSTFCDNLSSEEKILAWIESVVFQIMVNFFLMNSSNRAQKIVISGGLSHADAVCQKIADLSHTIVCRNDNTEATLQGIACMAAGIPDEWQPLINDTVFYPNENVQLQLRFDYWQMKMTQWLQ